jgi:putative ABC transport system permease protein
MTDRSQSTEDREGRAFRALLALYPAEFRDEYGRELTLVFADRYRRAGGPWARAAVWFDALTGLVQEAPRERLRVLRDDLRIGWRSVRQHAIVSTTIVVTLGLGIGANTAVFSVLNAIVLRGPLHVDAPDELHVIAPGPAGPGGLEATRLSGPTFDALHGAAPRGVGVAAMSRGIARVYTKTAAERDTTPANLQLVSPGFLPLLGVAPVRGRNLLASEVTGSAGAPEAVVSHAYWQSRFGGAPDAVGSTIVLNGSPFTVVGVGPPGFAGVWLESPVDIWVPLSAQPVVKYSQSFSADGADLRRPWLTQTGIWWLHVITRIPHGREAAAQRVLEAALAGTGDESGGLVLGPFARGFSRFRQQFAAPFVALLAMAMLVLCTACANVANLLLARAVARRRDLAIRMAIGAGRSRLLHLLLTESAMLVVLSSAASVLFARWAGDLLLQLAAGTLDGPVPFTTAIDLRVLAYTAGLAFVCVTMFGAWPAWRATRIDVAEAVKASSRSAVGRRGKASHALVVLQVAVSLVLVTGTALFVRSSQQLASVGLGFEPLGLLSATIDPRLSAAPAADAPMALTRMLDAVSAVPGVDSAALGLCGLRSPCAREDGYVVEGRLPRPGESETFAVNAVTPNYFSTVGMRLLAGRLLQDGDTAAAPKVTIINAAVARRYFGEPGRAVGRRLGMHTLDTEIVGVVDDVRALDNLRQAALPTLFMPLAQRPVGGRFLEVRTNGDAASLVGAVRRALTDAAPGLPIERIEPAALRVQHGLGQERVVAVVTTGFSALALGLAGFGLFGVLAYAVALRTPEIGLRIALGASRGDVVRRIVGDALWLVTSGILLGLPLVALGGQLLTTLVFGVSPYDGLSLAVAIGLLGVVGVASGLVPARRAVRIDPMLALRQD